MSRRTQHSDSGNSKIGYEPIPGYKLRKRIGAGGYGEVWLADAPGGLQKAVKLIYGTVDESHATSELRSLQRIRQVYHPFLLSIERIEIVSNQVIIITELAECSLLDRFEECRRKGSPGIPRASLMDYLRDTADALDFLAQKHGLQHLDVKPGNLLIIADRIKVADFGLIKDLRDQNQSLVSGLTPTYSAPEIFDGQPDFRSDQYSLAIVYMEMLTGQLPFTGGSTGELARQHIHQAPNLEALPPADRPIVARAMSKNPLDRFPTCRSFVEQLLKIRNILLSSSGEGRSRAHADGRGSVAERSSTLETGELPALTGRYEFQPKMDVEAISTVWRQPRALYIGLGGVGGKSLLALRKLVQRDCDSHFQIADMGWLAIDTRAASLDELTQAGQGPALPESAAVLLPIFRPSAYRNAEPELFGPLSRRWLYNIPRSLSTEGVRPLAILSLLAHYPQFKARLATELGELIDRQQQDEDQFEPLRIYVFSSLHGGTGSGLLAEVGLLVRRIMSELRFNNYRISALVSSATTTDSCRANLPAAAGIASMSELCHRMKQQEDVPSIYYADACSGAMKTRPFDWITLVDGGGFGDERELSHAIETMAAAAWLDGQTMVGTLLNETRTADVGTECGWLRTVATKRVCLTSSMSAKNLARWCCEQTLKSALAYMQGPRDAGTKTTSISTAMTLGTLTQRDSTSSIPPHSAVPASSPPKGAATNRKSAARGELPLTSQACEDFAIRLFNAMGLVQVSDSGHSMNQQTLIDTWNRRLSSEPELHQQQLAADTTLWKQSIAKIVKMRVYNWKQVEQIQLHIIESILYLCEKAVVDPNQVDASATAFEHLRHARTPAEALEATIGYLRSFGEKCLELMRNCQTQAKTMRHKLQSWYDSITAEKACRDSSWEVQLAGLSPRLQLLASRVNAVLESSVHRLVLKIVEDSGESTEHLPDRTQGDDNHQEFNLNYVLSLSSELVNRIAHEMDVTPEEFSELKADDNLAPKELMSFHPTLAEYGGQISRFVIAPPEQQTLVSQTLKHCKILRNTTLLPSSRSLGSYILCDGGNLSTSHIVTALWQPCAATLQLAERLRTRVDIDWPAVSQLFESAQPTTAFRAAASPAHAPIIPPLSPLPIGTQTLPLADQ